jgi:hypothetical protein
MAEEDKKSWLDRAWGWRDKIRDKTESWQKKMDQGDKYWSEKIKKQIPVVSEDIKDYTSNFWNRRNLKDDTKIIGNYLDWDRRMIGAATRTIPRAAGFDIDYYNPVEWFTKPMERNTMFPGIDFKKWDPSHMGVGVAQYLDTPVGNIMGGQYKDTLSLDNPESVASKFLKQYDSEDAYQAFINDNITDKDREKIKKEVESELNWSDWATKYPYNPKEDFYNLRNNLYANKTWDNFLDPYMKDVGDKYKERMLSEFGGYDTQGVGFMNNLGYGKLPMATLDGAPYTMDSDWFSQQVDDNPDNDSSYPEEFNFGAFDPLYEEWNKEFPFKYDEPEHYEHWMSDVPAAIISGGGVLKTLGNLSKRLPKWAQTGLKVAHPATSQLGKWPTTRGLAQTGIIPVLSEKFKQDYYYPSD